MVPMPMKAPSEPATAPAMKLLMEPTCSGRVATEWTTHLLMPALRPVASRVSTVPSKWSEGRPS